MPLKTPKLFYGRLRVALIIITLAIILTSYLAYSTSLSVSAERIVRGRGATYRFDGGSRRAVAARLSLSGDTVTGATVWCVKPATEGGLYLVTVTFSNGERTSYGMDFSYQGVGTTMFTASVDLIPNVDYYPKPSISVDVRKVM